MQICPTEFPDGETKAQRHEGGEEHSWNKKQELWLQAFWDPPSPESEAFKATDLLIQKSKSVLRLESIHEEAYIYGPKTIRLCGIRGLASSPASKGFHLRVHLCGKLAAIKTFPM